MDDDMALSLPARLTTGISCRAGGTDLKPRMEKVPARSILAEVLERPHRAHVDPVRRTRHPAAGPRTDHAAAIRSRDGVSPGAGRGLTPSCVNGGCNTPKKATPWSNAAQVPEQPGPGARPQAVGGPWGHVERLRRLRDGQSDGVPHLDQVHGLRVVVGKPGQGAVGAACLSLNCAATAFRDIPGEKMS